MDLTAITTHDLVPNLGLHYLLLGLRSIVMSVCCVTFAESEPCHSILFVWTCVGHSTTYSLPRLIDHNQIWSVKSCPRTRVSLFGSPISHTFGARGKNMQNFAYCSRHCCCDGRTVGRASGRYSAAQRPTRGFGLYPLVSRVFLPLRT